MVEDVEILHFFRYNTPAIIEKTFLLETIDRKWSLAIGSTAAITIIPGYLIWQPYTFCFHLFRHARQLCARSDEIFITTSFLCFEPLPLYGSGIIRNENLLL